MQRATITAKGEVQRVGYRDVVQRVARELDVTGFVENIKPYDVRIVAEGEGKTLKEFIKRIDVRKSPIFVEGLDVGFSKATSEFTYFEIKRGDIVEELGERFDVAGNVLYEIRDIQYEMRDDQKTMLDKQDQMLGKQDQMLDKQDQMLDKQDENTGVLSGKLDNIHNDLSVNLRSFHEDTIKRFDVVDVKYGLIAESMEKIFNEIKEERIESRRSMEKLIDAVIKLAEKK